MNSRARKAPWRRWLLLLSAVMTAGVLATWPFRPAPQPEEDTVRAVLQEREDNAGFARVTGPRPLVFPRDHGAHPEYRHEWWYVTGQLRSGDGSQRGFQLTFFRYALRPVQPASSSHWRSNQWVVAHFALSDAPTATFHHTARQSRAALELAGFSHTDAKVWLGDWRLARNADTDTWSLSAKTDEVELRLDLSPQKPLVLQGQQGYSPKSDEAGNASHYYSLPRLAGTGVLVLKGESRSMKAEAWLDHEWGTSGLGTHQVGWDWFALQLQDGRELTFYRLRAADGSTDPNSRGLLVSPDGKPVALAAGELHLTPTRWWNSPRTGIRYPIAWRVEVPAQHLDLQIEPLFDGQEWPDGLRYWEGAVLARNSADRSQIGRGYLELTGYARP